MASNKLFMLLIGCKPRGRNTEQHDIFFGIGKSLPDLLPQIASFWGDGGKLHIDAWRLVTKVGNFQINIEEKNKPLTNHQNDLPKLFFINLGGYKKGAFEEFHYKILLTASSKALAIEESKKTAFYQHTKFEGADSHIDDKYGIDVDEVYQIEDILSVQLKEKFSISLSPTHSTTEDPWHIGYTKWSTLEKQAASGNQIN